MESYQSIALGVAIVIFLITVFLSARRIIGWIFTLILLIIAAVTSLVISHQQPLPRTSLEPSKLPNEDGTDFKEHILQAINHINIELNQEKESLKKVSEGMQVLILQMDLQKQKLQAFIEEAKEKFSKLNHEPEEPSTQNEESKV